MKINFGSTSIFYLVVNLCSVASLIVNRFDADTLTTYYESLRAFANGESGQFSMNNLNFSEYCQELRKASIYETQNTGVIIEFPAGFKYLDMNFERTYVEEDTQKIQPKTILQVKKSLGDILLPSFQCSDFNGSPIWFITPAFIQNSALLFTIEGSHFHALSSQIKHKGKVVPKLSAIIDESADLYSTIKNFEIQKLSRNFILSHNTSTTTRDELCDQKPIIKNRLCALASTYLKNYDQYDDTEFASYNESWDNRNSCQPIEISLQDGTSITRDLLHCFVIIKKWNICSKFFLSLKNSGHNLVYIVEQNPENPNDMKVTGEMKVPLLDHIEDYQAALKDVDI